MSCHWHRRSALYDCGHRNYAEVNVREVLEVDITLFALKSSYCSKGAPQKGKSKLCPYACNDRCIRLHAFFSYCFCQSFVDSVVFWCHPSSCCEDKGIEWRLLYVNHSLVVFILLFFVLLVDLCQGLPRIWLWGRMCDLYAKESFLTAIPHSSRRDIQPCIVSSVDFSLWSFSLIGRSVGSVWTSLQTSLIICASESLFTFICCVTRYFSIPIMSSHIH